MPMYLALFNTLGFKVGCRCFDRGCNPKNLVAAKLTLFYLSPLIQVPVFMLVELGHRYEHDLGLNLVFVSPTPTPSLVQGFPRGTRIAHCDKRLLREPAYISPRKPSRVLAFSFSRPDLYLHSHRG